MASILAKLVLGLDPSKASLGLFCLGVVWTLLLNFACITCLEAKPRGTFLSEPSLLPGGAHPQARWNSRIPAQPFPRLTELGVRGKLAKSQFALDRRETLCVVGVEGDSAVEQAFSQLAFLVEHEFRWLSKDVLFLLAPNSPVQAEAVEDYLLQYERNASCAMQRTGPIVGAVVFQTVRQGNRIRINGRNGKLPNMDLINVVVQSSPTPTRLVHDNALDFAVGMLRGSDGLHAPFLDLGIQALTLELAQSNQDVLSEMEAIVRCLSNLGERFNRSFMFYIMLSTTKFVSVDEYLWSFGLVLSPLAISAFTTRSWTRAYLYTTLIGLGIFHLPLALLAASAVLLPAHLAGSRTSTLLAAAVVGLCPLAAWADFSQPLTLGVLMGIVLPGVAGLIML